MAKTEKPEVWLPPARVAHHHAGACDCEPTIVYIRVSKVGDREKIISPDIQLTACIADAKYKNKRIVKVVSDINKSGRNFTRRSVGAVIEDIKSGLAKSVTVWKWSRWGRNIEYSLAYISLVRDVGGRVDAATEDMDQSTASGRFSRDVIMRVDQLLSEQIGEGWQAAHAQRAADGLPHSGVGRFGYDYTKGSKGVVARYSVNPKEGPALATLYEKYVAGASLPVLAKWLNDQGFRTTRGGPWMPQAVGQMLDTGFGAGLLRGRSAETLEQAKGAPVNNNIANFEWKPGAHDPVIEMSLWEAFKARRISQCNLPPRLRTSVHVLSGLLYCGLCSRRLSTKYAGNGNRHYWICKRANIYHPGRPVSVTDAAAQRMVRMWVAEKVKGNTAESMLKVALDTDRRQPSTRTAAQVEAEISRELRAVDKLISMCARGVITEDQLTVAQRECDTKVRDLKSERDDLEQADIDGGGYAALRALDAAWDDRFPMDNVSLAHVIGMVIVSPVSARCSAEDLAARISIVPRWEIASMDPWLAAKRITA